MWNAFLQIDKFKPNVLIIDLAAKSEGHVDLKGIKSACSQLVFCGNKSQLEGFKQVCIISSSNTVLELEYFAW